MIFLAHRGYWLSLEEKNRRSALERAWDNSFGLEIDVRDAGGRLVISHDVPCGDEVAFDDFLTVYHQRANGSWMALNIKSDGLVLLLKQALVRYQVSNFFVFDMSTPELLNYEREGFPIAVRMSEFEREPLLTKTSTYIWLDSFEERWFDESVLFRLLEMGKTVAVVSPELHCRDHWHDWKFLKNKGLHNHPRMMLCTDFPLEARRFFSE